MSAPLLSHPPEVPNVNDTTDADQKAIVTNVVTAVTPTTLTIDNSSNGCNSGKHPSLKATDVVQWHSMSTCVHLIVTQAGAKPHALWTVSGQQNTDAIIRYLTTQSWVRQQHTCDINITAPTGGPCEARMIKVSVLTGD